LRKGHASTPWPLKHGVKGTGSDHMNSTLVKRQAPAFLASAQLQRNSFELASVPLASARDFS